MSIEYQLPFTGVEIHEKLNKIDGTKDYYNSKEIDDKLDNIENILHNKQDELTSYVSKINGKSGDIILTYDDVGALSNTTEIPTKVSALENDVGYQTEQQVVSAVANKQDKLVSYVSEINGQSGSVILTYNDVGALPDTTVIPTIPAKVSAFENDKGYLTQHQSLDNYALKSEVPTVPSNVSEFTNDAGYITNQNLNNYALKTEIPTVPNKVSAFTNDAGYLTSVPTHTHTTGDITSGTLSTDRLPTVSVAKGGTGYTSIVDTTYTTARYRASTLNASETSPSSNGVIAWMYE